MRHNKLMKRTTQETQEINRKIKEFLSKEGFKPQKSG